MALPEDFSKIYGSTATGGLTPISDVNYAKGWEFVGANPPTKNDFSYLQNLSDQKSQWLYLNKLQRTDPFGDIKSDGTVAQALSNLGIGSASLTTQGLVRLTSSRVSGAEDIAATANAVAQNYTDIKSLQNKTQDSTTTQKGIVQLTSSRVSDSETLAATAKAAAMNYADIVALQGKTNDATTTNKGIIRVSDSRTSSESGVAASSLAASQNYNDIKTTFGQIGEKGRVIGVTYTNTQAMTIHVHVSGIASQGSVFLSAVVNGINMNGSQSTNIAGQLVCISFMVPAGATYQVGISGGTLSSQSWVETDKK